MKTPTLIPNLIWRETDDGIVVVDPKEGKVRVLNGVGSDIWKLIGEEQSTDSIQNHIVENYSITAEQAEQDVSAFLSQLSERGMITWS